MPPRPGCIFEGEVYDKEAAIALKEFFDRQGWASHVSGLGYPKVSLPNDRPIMAVAYRTPEELEIERQR